MTRFFLTVLTTALLAGGCVVTTHEKQSAPPQGASKPIWPPLGEVPKEPIEEGQGVGAPASAVASAPASIVASHILVMHRDSQRAPPHVTRSKAEARARAEEALARVRAGDDWAQIVREYSDDSSSTQAGSLGRISRGVTVREFENAAFGLEPGEVSDLVESPFGFHIIKRDE